MKRLFIFIISLVLVTGCDKPDAGSPRLTDAGMLEVSFAYKGKDTRSIALSPANQSVSVEVKMNSEKVGWMVRSDSEWCVVDEEQTYSGSGAFTVSVQANEAYEQRNAARVVLSAGEYQTELIVNQRGNVFLLDDVYAMSNKTAGTAVVSVRVLEDVEWDMECPAWISATKGSSSSADGEVITEVTLAWDANEAESRYGSVGFVRGDEEASAYFSGYQFGTEYDTAEDGTVVLPAKGAAPIVVKAPANTFDGIVCPEWVTAEMVENEDNTVRWNCYFLDNRSDAESLRDTELKLSYIGEADDMPLPVITQDFYPAGGLVSAAGFLRFAERFNAGEDVSPWVTDGVVKILENVDLSDITGWTPIGTEERPFDLEFDGGFRKISNFRSSSPLFGVCSGAVISNVVFDETCSFALKNDFISDVYFASLAGKVMNTEVKDCSSAAGLEMTAAAVSDNLAVCAAGLVAYVDEESSMTDCSFTGSLKLADSVLLPYSSDSFAYVGGVAGYLGGILENGTSGGSVSDASAARKHFVGGVAGMVASAARLSGCSGSAAVTQGSVRLVNGKNDASRYVHAGGVAGYSEGISENLVNDGTLKLTTDAKFINAGGVLGSAATGTVAGLVNKGGSIASDGAGRYVYLGGLVGLSEIVLDFPEAGTCNVDISCKGLDGSDGAMLGIGGFIGGASGNLSLNSPVWSGTITYDFSAANSCTADAGVGGIVGLVNSGAFLEIDGASASGNIALMADDGKTYKGAVAFGGVVGAAQSGADISDAVSSVSIKWNIGCGRSNGSIACMGGIVGRINEGVSSLRGCTASGNLMNWHYNNNGYEKGAVMANRTGGVIGCYGYVAGLDEETSGITISDCHCTAEVLGYRGLVGGIAGCLVNATVSDCTFTGKCTDTRENPYVGGIAGALENSSVNGCDVTAPLAAKQAGSCPHRAGGIAALLFSGSSIENCRFYGHITKGKLSAGTTEQPYYDGGIVAETEAGCVVKNCGFGGTLLGEQVNESNCGDLAVGNKAVEAEGTYYWKGE